jgi:sugar lactone lactonase YvrE
VPDARARARRTSQGRSVAAAVGMLLLAGGCALGRGPDLKPLVWPEPPQRPRIEFVTAVASERDLEGGFSMRRFVEVGLIGAEQRVWHLYQPIAVVPSDDGKRVYVADYSQALLYIFDFERGGTEVIGSEGGFSRPIGVALDGAGRVYVCDQKAKAVQILTPDGKAQGRLPLDHIEQPGGIAIDRTRGLLYVVDTGGYDSTEHGVRVYDLQGTYLRSVGEGRGAGPGELYFPTYVAVDGTGQVYVSDTMNGRVSIFDAEGTFLRVIGKRGDGFGEFDKPKGVALDTFGNLYVVDSSWSNVQIFNSRGDVLLYFGGRSRYPGMLENPTGIAIDRENRIYVCDTFNHRLNVYRLVNTTAADSFVNPAPADEKGGASAPSTVSMERNKDTS